MMTDRPGNRTNNQGRLFLRSACRSSIVSEPLQRNKPQDWRDRPYLSPFGLDEYLRLWLMKA
jgi:hypothetical protein